jgi:hypothetical protein
MKAKLLRRVSAPITDTPAFKAWFTGSKVVDKQGNPLRVFHATNRSFDEFNMDAKAPKRPEFTSFQHKALGAFFASDPEDAEPYAKGAGSNIMPVDLHLTNPYKMTYAELFSIRTTAQAKKMRRDIDNLNHDGIWVSRNNPELDWWIAFRPNQIKSVIGNNGEFDPESNSITSSLHS